MPLLLSITGRVITHNGSSLGMTPGDVVPPSGYTFPLQFVDVSGTEDGFRVRVGLEGGALTLFSTLAASGSTGDVVEEDITGLDYNTAYDIEVVSFDGATESAGAAMVLNTPVEAALTGVTATALSPSSIEIDATGNPDPPIAGGYLVEYYAEGATEWGDEFYSVTLPVTITGLPANTLITARLFALNDNSDGSRSLSPASATVTATTDEFIGDSLITDQSSGTPRNDYIGRVGYAFSIDAYKTVTHVGWPWKTGDTDSHEVGIYTSDNTLVASATVPGTEGINGTYNKVALRIVLPPNNYRVGGLVISGDDTWHDLATLSPSGAATISSAIYSDGTGAAAFQTTGTTNQGMGPPTIYFEP